MGANPILLSLILILVHFILVYGAWRTWCVIPARRYTPWLLPLNLSQVPLPLMQHIRVRLRVRPLRFNGHEKRVTLSIPPRSSIGTLFSYFVLHGLKESPEYLAPDENDDRTSGWEFYERRWFGLSNRILDPEKSLLENKLESYSIVVAKQID